MRILGLDTSFAVKVGAGCEFYIHSSDELLLICLDELSCIDVGKSAVPFVPRVSSSAGCESNLGRALNSHMIEVACFAPFPNCALAVLDPKIVADAEIRESRSGKTR